MNTTKKPKTTTLELKIIDLVVPEERRPEFEKMAEQMTDLADSIGYFDPLEAELALIFNPTVSKEDLS